METNGVQRWWKTIRRIRARLRERASSIMEADALANGVHGKRIDTHSPRAGGATALYTQGAPLDVIQRWGRRKSLTFHHYLRRDATALNKLSEVFVKSDGFSKCLRLTNDRPKSVSFLLGIKPWSIRKNLKLALLEVNWLQCFCQMIVSQREVRLQRPEMNRKLLWPQRQIISNRSVFRGTRLLSKRGELGKKESSEDGDVTKVELFSGEGGFPLVHQ